jgi:type IV pilus assembly protein PilW
MRRLHHGFSLVELMVALTLALVVTAGVLSVFVGTRTVYQSTSGVASLTDSGSFALNFLEQSIRGAGYVACNHATLSTNVNLLDATEQPLAYDFRYGVEGYEANGTGPNGGAFTVPGTPTADQSGSDWTPVLDSEFFAALTTGAVSGSDVLVIRSSTPRTAEAYLATDVASGSTAIQVTNGSALNALQPAAISDCTESVTFLVAASAPTGGSPATIQVGSSLPIGFSTGAVITPVTTMVYYVGIGSDGDTALRRLQLQGGAAKGVSPFLDQEMVPDIENLQVLYGIDTTDTQTASTYVTADQVTDFNTVVSVKVAVLAASPANLATPIPGAPLTFNLLGTSVTVPNDTRKRRIFTTTVTVRSAAE